MKGVVVGAVIAAVLLCAGCYEISLWNECRKDHSWFYCQRVLGR